MKTEHWMTTRWRSPEFRAARSAAIREGQSSPEFRRKRRSITRKLWKTPAYREKVTLALQEAMARPEVSVKKSASIKKTIRVDPSQLARLRRPRPRPLSPFVQAWFGLGPLGEPREDQEVKLSS